MVSTTIRPGRSAAVRAPGGPLAEPEGSLRILVACLCALLAGCCSSVQKKPPPTSQHLLFELDYVEGLLSVAETGDGATLGAPYEKVGFKPDVQEEFHRTETALECMDSGELDAFVRDSRDDPTREASGWRVHGVIVPACCTELNPSADCSKYDGQIWLGADGIRQDFVVFSRATLGAAQRLGTTVHEAGHVLNLHHCEYNSFGDLGSVGEFGERSKEHLKERDSHADHVSPGPTSKPWCDMTEEHRQIHTVELELGHTGCSECLSSDSVSAQTVQPGVTLSVMPEKQLYQPGEPVTVEALLTADRGGLSAVPYRSESALDPSLGYLTLWVAAGPNGPYSVLPAPYPAEAVLGTASLRPGDIVRESGIDGWFSLPSTGIDGGHSYWLKATFEGFADPLRRIASVPVEVKVAPLTQPHLPGQQQAHELFTRKESRLFVAFLGGDPRGSGMADLEKISRNFGSTIYAPYADLALGLRWLRPFHHLENGVIRAWPANPEKAVDHLSRAYNRITDLPPSYRPLLRYGLGRAHAAHGDSKVEADPNGALASYELARDDFQHVRDSLAAGGFSAGPGAPGASPAGPVSVNGKRLLGLSGAALQDVNRKILEITRGISRP